jgi:hypothetical protein
VTASLCVSPYCKARGYHQPDCADADCGGCVPRLAADGLRLCHVHTRRIAEDAAKAAELHDELTLRLTGAGQAGQRMSGTPDHGTELDPRAVEARATIRHTLVSWCRLIAEERGHALPADTLTALAGYVAKHAEWLAATEYAGEVSDELHTLVSDAYPIAYPSGARVFAVGGCPHDGCTGTVKAILRRVDSLLPSALQCDADEAHCYPADQWIALGRKLRAVRTAQGCVMIGE